LQAVEAVQVQVLLAVKVLVRAAALAECEILISALAQGRHIRLLLEQEDLEELGEQTDPKEATQHLALCLPPKAVDTVLQEKKMADREDAVVVPLEVQGSSLLVAVVEF
jgi:hypothetical protein